MTGTYGLTRLNMQGRSGLCVAKTKQAILLGHHGEAQQAGNATQTVEALADYLISAGY
jgi:profilin